MAKYVYPAIISPSEDGGFTVRFPDVSGCYTEGNTLDEAIEQAQDALCLMLYDMEEREETPPVPTDVKDVRSETDDIVSLVTCDTLEYRQFNADPFYSAANTERLRHSAAQMESSGGTVHELKAVEDDE